MLQQEYLATIHGPINFFKFLQIEQKFETSIIINLKWTFIIVAR